MLIFELADEQTGLSAGLVNCISEVIRPTGVVHPEVWLPSRRRITMRKKRHTPEEIVAKLRQVDVLVAQGTPVADAIRAIGVTEVAPRRTAE